MLFRTTYKRMNFGLATPLTQSTDVLVQSDLSLADNADEISSLLYQELIRANPSWEDYSPPAGLTTGWSSIMGGLEITEVPESQMLALAWHCKKQEWLLPDKVNTTIDPDEAGRFLPQDIDELNLTHAVPDSKRPVFMSNLVSDIFGESNQVHSLTTLEIIYDEFVLWGYGPKESSVVHIERPHFKIFGHVIPFRLPETSPHERPAQEYERITSWAWRFNYGHGANWELAESQAAAEATAKAQAIKSMRETGAHNCHEFFACKYNTKVISLASESTS